MSKGGFSKEREFQNSPAEQVRYFADLCRNKIDPATIQVFATKMKQLGLSFEPDELIVFAALDTPAKVQEFLNNEIYYNWDHGEEDVEETTMSPRKVLQTGTAHCFEGAMFALGVNYLHGHNPKMVLMEASQDSEHNLIIVQDQVTGLYGANAHSAFPNLGGRAAEFSTIRALSESYYPYYYSDRTFDAKQLTLVGYSEPFDVIAKYGIQWMASNDELWDIYFTYIDDSISFHYLFDDSPKSHLYPLLHALKEGWIIVDKGRKAGINTGVFPPMIFSLWNSFWKEFDDSAEVPTGISKEREEEFRKLTGTTPIDLLENVDELQGFLDRGYLLDRILT